MRLSGKKNNVSYFILYARYINNTYTMLSFNLFIEENDVTATLFLLDESFVFFFFINFVFLVLSLIPAIQTSVQKFETK